MFFFQVLICKTSINFVAQKMQTDQTAISGDPPPETTEILDEPQPDSGEVPGDVSHDPAGISSSSYTMGNQKEIMKALETVERDSVAIAESFVSLFSSLRLSLSEVLHIFLCIQFYFFVDVFSL
jgi:hypothetical protein